MSLRRLLLDRMPLRWRGRLRQFKAEVHLLRSVIQDWQQFRRYSGLCHPERADVLEGHILKTYHRLEKGLAMPAPRPGFGVDVALQLIGYLQVQQASTGPDQTSRAALNTLQNYLDFNAQSGRPLPEVEGRVAPLVAWQGSTAVHGRGGVLHRSGAAIAAQASVDFESFALSRHSVRQFAPGHVPVEAIESAVRCALKAPSVCNRQSGLVYVVRDPADRQRVLAFQNGNRGFGDHADVVLIVASRLAMFHTPGERYQAWIDGGLFAMSLLHGLHAKGLGACCLNWSVTREHDAEFKRITGLSDGVEVIMMIAVGLLPDAVTVAESPRRDLAEVLIAWPPEPIQ